MSPTPVSALLIQAQAHQRQAQWAQALLAYEQVLTLVPQHPQALMMAGAIAAQTGQHARATGHWEHLLQLQPDDARTWNNLGSLYQLQHQDEAAQRCWLRAVALRPDYAEAWNQLGQHHAAQARWSQALDCYQRALQAEPGLWVADFNAGEAHRQLQAPAAALACFARVTAAQPGLAMAWSLQGLALQALGRLDEALACCRRAVQLQPDLPEAHHDLGSVLASLHRYDAALASLQQALALRPGYVSAHVNLGNAWFHLGRLEAALAAYEQALQLDPAAAAAQAHRARVLKKLKRLDEAAAAFAALVAQAPDYPLAWGDWVDTLALACDWPRLTPALQGLRQALQGQSLPAAPMVLLARFDEPDLLRDYACRYARQEYPSAAQPLWRGERYAHERLRVAYLSPDFRNHATAYLAARLFELHDRARLEVRAVSLVAPQPDPMRERLLQAFEHFTEAHALTDLQIARQLRDWEADIVVDLAGYSDMGRPGVFALRPAPVQVSYLGYPGTTGLADMDYCIVDAITAPPGHEAFFTEQLVRMPASYQVNDALRSVPALALQRSDEGLPAEGFVFCCFNNNHKITPEVFALWMRLLAAVPGSVLWLMGDNPFAERHLRQAAQAQGIDAQRLVFAQRCAVDRHLARQRLADLFLDTLPYNAHTTASDALRAGLPVLTCAGQAFAGRVAASLLHAVGVPELVVPDAPSYEALALALARDPQRLCGLRARLQQVSATAPLWDTAAFCRALESAYTRMAQRSRQGLPAQGFSV